MVNKAKIFEIYFNKILPRIKFFEILISTNYLDKRNLLSFSEHCCLHERMRGNSIYLQARIYQITLGGGYRIILRKKIFSLRYRNWTTKYK